MDMLNSLKRMFMINLQVLHLPKIYLTTDNDSYVVGLASKCPKLKEIGFTIDEQVCTIPIDGLFAKSQTLEAMHMRFDIPKALIETGDEAAIEDINKKHLIGRETYGRLKKLTIQMNAENIFLAWVDCKALFKSCINLEHLEISRCLKYRTIARKIRDIHKQLKDSNYFPDKVKGKIKMHKLKTLIIKNYFNIHFITELVANNRYLQNLKIHRKSYGS